MGLYVSKIDGMLEAQLLTNDERKVIDIFLSAINDWPDALETFEEYENQVSIFIGGETTEKNLVSAMKVIAISSYAWQAESIATVIEVFKFSAHGSNLKEIIQVVSRKLCKS